jgi:transcriptional regulator with XRE-family HTH domain
MQLDAVQCRMARAALGLGVRDLATLADVSPNTIARLERGEALHRRTQAFIRGFLEAEGVSFIDGGTPSIEGGQGARLGLAEPSPYSDLWRALWSLPDFHREPATALIALTDIFASYLEIIRSERREPDVWERLNLRDALEALSVDNPFMAFACLRPGITPPDNQSRDYPISREDAAAVAPVDLAYLSEGLAKLRASRGQNPSG